MADHVSEQKRSYIMSRVPSKNSMLELAVRKALHARGLRFRLHSQGLPGTPDIVFSRQRIAIFVHGCFWHGHSGCSKSRLPGTRRKYWSTKINRNRKRDAENLNSLTNLGWRSEVIWGCEVKDPERLERFVDRVWGRIQNA